MKENPKFKGILLDENDNPIPGTEFIGWHSRSVAVTVVICDKTHKHFLLERRGYGCPDNIGKWCLCCGYVNWGEWIGNFTDDMKVSEKLLEENPDISFTETAATREVYEETGLHIKPHDLRFIGINDSPFANRQNITLRYIYDKLSVEELKDLMESGTVNCDTVSRGGEFGECDEIRVMSIEECADEEFAFNHKQLIYSIAFPEEYNA